MKTLFQIGDELNIEGDLYLITKTPIGNSKKLRVNLKMIKNIDPKNNLYGLSSEEIIKIVSKEDEKELKELFKKFGHSFDKIGGWDF